MAENKNSLFRKSSMDYIDSPEKLDIYLRVTSPGVRALLGTIIVLLIGVIIWGMFGRLETHVPAAVVVDGSEKVCLVPEAALRSVVDHPSVTVDGTALTLAPDILEPVVITEDTNVYILLAGELSFGDVVYEIPLADDLEEGIYKGTITTETISPASLLLN